MEYVEYAREFCGLALITALDDATLNSLFWIGANYHRPVDLSRHHRTELEGRDPPVSGATSKRHIHYGPNAPTESLLQSLLLQCILQSPFLLNFSGLVIRL
ncbi:hypothetical protein QQF64_028894 [Cirrhinus molitorella]|uniref:Uncharacterized protein n=1 Tax=Cirrhinus molitorella TaxID=172907 RepID=A0ABR3N7V0_9TELE